MKYLFVIAGLMMFSACEKESLDTAFIHLEPFELSTTDGSTSSAIVDAWVYVDDVLVGGFPLPGDVPIKRTGSVKIEVFPGIRELGPNSLELFKYVYPELYPLYERFTAQVDLTYGKTDTLYPKTKYLAKAKTVFFEGFETPPHIFNTDEDKNLSTFIDLSTTLKKEGLRGGVIQLDTTNNLCDVSTDLFYIIPTDNSPIYVEVDHIGNSLQFGLIGIDDKTGQKSTVLEYVLPEKPEWNKNYINITRLLQLSKLSRYKIVLRSFMAKDDAGKYKALTKTVGIDNIRLVYLDK
jgi:hypothetical protein